MGFCAAKSIAQLAAICSLGAVQNQRSFHTIHPPSSLEEPRVDGLRKSNQSTVRLGIAPNEDTTDTHKYGFRYQGFYSLAPERAMRVAAAEEGVTDIEGARYFLPDILQLVFSPACGLFYEYVLFSSSPNAYGRCSLAGFRNTSSIFCQ